MKSSLIVIVLLAFCYEIAVGSECGESTIPYSLEVLPSGQPILGCARPSCFGWHPNGHQLPTTAKFFRIDQQSDGFLRDDPLAIHTFNAADPRVYSQQQATCEHEFQSLSCNSENQWVGGISPVMNATTTQVIAYQCCTYPPLRASTDRGIATVSGGQIVVGGEVLENNRQYAFDYISNIEKKIDEEGEIFYDVNIRRFSCLDLQNVDRSIPDVLNAENVIRHVNGQRAVAHQAPNVAVETPVETGELVVPAGVVNGQEVIIEEIVAQQGFIEDTTEAPPPPPPQPQPQPPQGFQPQPFQPQPFQPQPFQPQVFQPVQQPVAVPAQPNGYFMGYSPPAGLQLYYCFPGDSTVFLTNGGRKRMDELEAGDWVQALTDDGSSTISVPVKYWLHRNPDQEAHFLQFSLDNGEKFELTEKHLVYVGDCKVSKNSNVNIHANPTPAEKVNIGDCFYIAHRNPVNNKMYQTVKVLGIDMVKKTGIYAPMTSVGSILVNRIHTSCLSETDNQTLQDSFFASLLHIKNTIIGYIWNVENTSNEENLGYGLNGVIDLLDLVIPSNLI